MEQAITGLVEVVVGRGILGEVEEEMVVTVEAAVEPIRVPVL